MSPGNKIIIFSFLIFFITFSLQYNLSGQNLIVIHKKFSNTEYALQIGKRVKVVTLNNQIIKGVITNVKDSTIKITNKKLTREISIKDISYLSFKKRPWLNYSLGALLAVPGILLAITYIWDPKDPDASGNPSGTAVLLTPACLLFFSGKRYDTHKYELIIVKPTPIIQFDKIIN